MIFLINRRSWLPDCDQKIVDMDKNPAGYAELA